MNIISLIKLTENDKRLIAVLLLLLILIFVIVGYLVVLVQKIMKYQGDQVDKAMHDMVITGVVHDSKTFRRIAFYKSRQRLFLKSRIPAFLLLLAGLLTLIFFIIYHSNGWTFDFFQFNNGTKNEGGSGFTTLMFLWNYNASEAEMIPQYFSIFGLKITVLHPPLLNEPHLSVAAIPTYIIVTLMLVGSIWFLVQVQAYIARTLRIFKLSKSIFSKSLENFNAAKNTFEDNNDSNASNENSENK